MITTGLALGGVTTGFILFSTNYMVLIGAYSYKMAFAIVGIGLVIVSLVYGPGMRRLATQPIITGQVNPNLKS
jgi:hypothetical protein